MVIGDDAAVLGDDRAAAGAGLLLQAAVARLFHDDGDPHQGGKDALHGVVQGGFFRVGGAARRGEGRDDERKRYQNA